jgi:ABC-2 type transport system permease protein
VAVSFDFWAYVLGSYLGLVLFGAAFIAIGILISSMTENQIVAAILTYAVMILLLTLGDIANMLPLPFLASALYWLSFETKYNAFVSGVVSLDNILFFISVTVVCLFMTTRVLEKRRWS